MEKKSFELADLTGNLKISNKGYFKKYLKEIWIDLISRYTKNENDKIKNNVRQDLVGITKLIFSKYYSLPGIIGDRLFRVFDSNNNGVLEFNEFKMGMITLFCQDYETTLRFIFDFYDFDGDGKISKEDIRVVLSYITFSDKDIIENEKSLNINNNLNNKDKMSKISKKLYESSVKTQNQLIELLDKCFKYNGELIDYRNFADIVEKINSDIFFMIILFLLEKRPFSFKSIQLYHNIYYNKYLSNSDISLKLSGINDNSISISKSYINRTLTSNNISKNIITTTANSR
jgi:Ca2+-binding EF-hand superfamily protein